MGRHKQVSDEAVLLAAREVFTEAGFGASTRTIARRAGISEAVLYQRHKTKIDLFFAAMIPPPLELAVQRAPGRRRAVLPELEALAIEILGYFRGAMPVLLQLVTHPRFQLSDLVDGERRMPLHRLGDAVIACIEGHREEGRITADSQRVQAAALTLLASLHSLALFERIGVHGGAFPDRAVKNIVGLIVAGLTATGGNAP
jgi:AcrR family transcriptional regulator